MRYAVFVNRFLRRMYSNGQLAEALADADAHGGEVYDFWAWKRANAADIAEREATVRIAVGT